MRWYQYIALKTYKSENKCMPMFQHVDAKKKKLRPKTRKRRPPYFLYFCPSVLHFSNLQPPAYSTVYAMALTLLLSIPLVNFKAIAKKETENNHCLEILVLKTNQTIKQNIYPYGTTFSLNRLN